MKLLRWLDRYLEETLLVILLVVIACVSLFQVAARNLPWLSALTWAEEFCRFCWIWSVFLSLPYTIRKGTMLRVNVLLDLMPHVIRKTLNIIVDIVVTGSMGLLAYHSISVTQGIAASAELSPAMLWPMSIIYGVMLAGYALATVRGVQMTIIHVTHFGEKELSTIEQTMADAAEEAAAGKRAEGGEA